VLRLGVAKLLFPALKNKQKIKVVWFLNYFTFTKTKKRKNYDKHSKSWHTFLPVSDVE